MRNDGGDWITLRAGERNLRVVLTRHRGQRTVLGVALPVLDEYIRSAEAGVSPSGLSEREIEEGFQKLTDQFIHSDYHSTYIARRLGKSGFLDLRDGRYWFRGSLASGCTLDELRGLRAELLDSLRSAYEERQAAIRRLEETCALPSGQLDERSALVREYLSQISGNHGEMFEVVSFAVLREYFRTFGFSLQRFSTTHANDGGMDFVAADAIYQVTTDESVEKVRRDLRKAPGTKRVMVRPTVSPDILEMCKHEVLETIELKDLLNHFISWLSGRDSRLNRSTHLQQVLTIALEEFRREDKASVADNPGKPQ